MNKKTCSRHDTCVQVRLPGEFRLTAVETMGRYGGGQGQEFAQEFQLEYWRVNFASTIHMVNRQYNTVGGRVRLAAVRQQQRVQRAAR